MQWRPAITTRHSHVSPAETEPREDVSPSQRRMSESGRTVRTCPGGPPVVTGPSRQPSGACLICLIILANPIHFTSRARDQRVPERCHISATRPVPVVGESTLRAAMSDHERAHAARVWRSASPRDVCRLRSTCPTSLNRQSRDPEGRNRSCTQARACSSGRFERVHAPPGKRRADRNTRFDDSRGNARGPAPVCHSISSRLPHRPGQRLSDDQATPRCGRRARPAAA
jgi:hypothetical protein